MFLDVVSIFPWSTTMLNFKVLLLLVVVINDHMHNHKPNNWRYGSVNCASQKIQYYVDHLWRLYTFHFVWFSMNHIINLLLVENFCFELFLWCSAEIGKFFYNLFFLLHYFYNRLISIQYCCNWCSCWCWWYNEVYCIKNINFFFMVIFNFNSTTRVAFQVLLFRLFLLYVWLYLSISINPITDLGLLKS